MKLDSLVLKHEEYKKAFVAEATATFNDFVKEFFVEVPEVKTIKWCQYTPYFNDGNTCEFTMNGIFFSNAAPEHCSSWGEFSEDFEEKDEDFIIDGGWIKDDTPMSAASRKKIKAFHATMMSGAMEEVLVDMFGEHSEITITADSIEIDEFEHD